MAFTKVTYVDGETTIPAENLNDIQDELIRIASIASDTHINELINTALGAIENGTY